MSVCLSVREGRGPMRRPCSFFIMPNDLCSQLSSQVRSRAWCFTINNYGPGTVGQLRNLSSAYTLFGYERGECGTPHLQGYVYFRNPRRFSNVKNILPHGAHIERAQGSVEQNIAYCKKDGEFEECGHPPVTSVGRGVLEQQRWENARAAAQRGDLDQVPPDIYVRYYRTLKEISKDHMLKPSDLGDTCGLWYYGMSGTGKSFRARLEYPDAYLKMCNKWWDGYQGESFVIIDDLDKKHEVLGHHLKIWADRYSFIAETKGGAICIRPMKIIVTSNYEPAQIWEDVNTLGPIYRRFSVIEVK